jgi:uncharacterized protein (DUF302 family)
MMSEQTKTVTYADPGAAAATFQNVRTSALSVQETVTRLRDAIEEANFWVLHEIDPQMLLRRGGYAIGETRQILFFHPRIMERLLAADPAALLEAPLKFAVMALPDGTVTVRWPDPTIALARYDNAELAAVGQELAAACRKIAAGI